MTYDDLISHFGSEAAVQRALKLKHRQTVHKWKSMDRVPTDQQIAAEIATSGILLADLPPELRQSIQAAS